MPPLSVWAVGTASGWDVTLQYPRADLAPDIAYIFFAGASSLDPALRIATEADMDDEVIDVPTVQTLQVTGATSETLAVDIEADGVTDCYVAFTGDLVGGANGVTSGTAWEIHAWGGAALHLRGLPDLPNGGTLAGMVVARSSAYATVYATHTRARRTAAYPAGAPGTIEDIMVSLGTWRVGG